MPFVDISYIETQHTEKCISKICNVVQSSLIEHFDISEKNFFQLLHPKKPEHVLKDSTFNISGIRSDKYLVIKITCTTGRTIQQKQGLYNSIASGISKSCNIPKDDIFILLYETAPSAWSFGDGIAFSIYE